MRRCASGQGGRISRWSALSIRFYTSEPSAAEGGALRSEDVPDNLELLAHHGADENKGQRPHTLIEHEDGAINSYEPSTWRSLPLSPLMDPAYLAAKQKYRLPKAAPSKEPTPFQRKLAKNPYGMI
jgi:hypothetical protein